jgi:RNA polymerase sigma-70 factor (ECF subfamily)
LPQKVSFARSAILRIIEAYRAGRPDAFNELVASYEGTVHRLLAGFNVTSADIEDLTQEVFLRVFRNLHRFRGQSPFYTWLYRSLSTCSQRVFRSWQKAQTG